MTSIKNEVSLSIIFNHFVELPKKWSKAILVSHMKLQPIACCQSPNCEIEYCETFGMLMLNRCKSGKIFKSLLKFSLTFPGDIPGLKGFTPIALIDTVEKRIYISMNNSMFGRKTQQVVLSVPLHFY